MSRQKPMYCEQCRGKRLYKSEQQARDGMGRVMQERTIVTSDLSLNVYECPHNQTANGRPLWHFGHNYAVDSALRGLR